MSDALLDDTNRFLVSHIQSTDDLEIAKLKNLLEVQKAEQKELDAKLNKIAHASKKALIDSEENLNSQQKVLQQLLGNLEETKQHVEKYEADHSTPTTSQHELLIHLKQLEEKLRRVDNARNYIKTLLVACELSSQALDYVETDPGKAIKPYEQLVKFERYISSQPMATEQYSELCDYLKKRQTQLWEELNAVLIKSFKSALGALSWPTPIKPPYGPQIKEKLEKFESTFRHLIILQQSSAKGQQVSELSPVSIMLEDLSLRFKYHFETSKPTNRLDKPEWYLTHVRNTITTHIPFLMTTVQPILDSMKDYFPERVFVKDLFIHGLLQDVFRKLHKSMPQAIQQPNILSHTIHQILEFDKSLSEEFAYDDTTVSNFVLGNPIWFNTWFQAEKTFSQARYDEIMMDGQVFEIDSQDTNNNAVKKTKSAIRLMNLLESITSTYSLVPHLTHKLKFFIEIQLDLLSQYHKRLSSAVDSFEALSLIRSVPAPGALPDAVTGVMTANETHGTLAALHRLYRWWTSAKAMSEMLRDWDDDEFFIDLNFEIKQDTECMRRILKEHQDRNTMLSYARLMESGSSDSLFADALTAYNQIAERIEKVFVKIAVKEWTNNARAYSRKDWWHLSTDNGATTTEMSDEIYAPLQDFRMTFTFLNKILPEPDFLIVYRKTLKEIEDWYLRNIITRQLPMTGVDQLETDLKLGLWKIGQKWVQKPENLMKKLKESIIQLKNQ
ncbi:hypothetical protein CU097_014935 [Rhizopus azygosporus]|uniref:RAD50-interacting protein 1 n=1 Tax=Rhizopus azygosporus TaxID=86630 RepID=A0A367K7V5_RHIAZ|nr:hypothetical protein CU097_014935 [Rhizopus azygosporus]